MSRLIKCPGCIACTVPADRAPVCDGSGFLRDRRAVDDLLAEAVELLKRFTEYAEEMEEVDDWERGDCRKVDVIIAVGEMPDVWTEAKAFLDRINT